MPRALVAEILLVGRGRRGALAVLPALLLGGFLLALVRTAWVCDDAYLTLRTVDNLRQGFGPRWNVEERVQIYTHPAWMALLALAGLLEGEAYYSTIALGAAVSIATVALIAWRLPWPGCLTALALLAGSKAFVDFSTSGLENPFTHLLLTLFVLACRGEAGASRLVLLAGLLALSRLDALLLVTPAIGLALWRRQGGWLAALAAGLPLAAWEAFSILYYGAPFPNTAYAKLGAGIPPLALMEQGLHYLVNSLRLDPLTLTTILAGVIAGLRSPSAADRALASGVLLDLAYVVRAGGDFMAGRFFTAPFLVACLLVARTPWRGHTVLAPAILALSLLPPRAPLRSGADYAHRERDQGIADERGVYFQATGLWAERGALAPPQHPRIEAGRELRASGRRLALTTAAGLTAYYAGPGVHFVDLLALGDPLLARLPVPPEWPWRVGHYERALPDGYIETLRTGVNQIRDPEVAALYDCVRLATRGPLLEPRRLRAIVALNFGRAQQCLRPGEVGAVDEDRVPDPAHRLEAPEAFHQRAVGGIEVHTLQVGGADRHEVSSLDLARHVRSVGGRVAGQHLGVDPVVTGIGAAEIRELDPAHPPLVHPFPEALEVLTPIEVRVDQQTEAVARTAPELVEIGQMVGVDAQRAHRVPAQQNAEDHAPRRPPAGEASASLSRRREQKGVDRQQVPVADLQAAGDGEGCVHQHREPDKGGLPTKKARGAGDGEAHEDEEWQGRLEKEGDDEVKPESLVGQASEEESRPGLRVRRHEEHPARVVLRQDAAARGKDDRALPGLRARLLQGHPGGGGGAGIGRDLPAEAVRGPDDEERERRRRAEQKREAPRPCPGGTGADERHARQDPEDRAKDQGRELCGEGGAHRRAKG